MSSIIIESRQTNGSIKQIGVNGQYTSSIKAPITISDGDTIQIRNVFIDSVDQAQTIPVLADTTLTMKYITFATLNTDLTLLTSNNPGDHPLAYVDNTIYFKEMFGRNDTSNPVANNAVWNRTSNLLKQGGNIGDGFQYCATVKSTADNTHQRVVSITIFPNVAAYQKWGGNPLTWFYTNPAGHEVSYVQHVPVFTTTSSSYIFTFPDDSGPVFLIADGFALFNTNNPWVRSNPNFNMALDSTLSHTEGGLNAVPPVGFKPDQATKVPKFSGSVVQTGDSYTPVVQTKSITIPAGNYNPSVLSNIISRKFNACIGNLFKPTAYMLDERVHTGEDANPNTTPTLFQNLAIGAVNPTDTLAELYIASIDDANIIGAIFCRDDLPSLIGGCANFELDFDNDTQTFKIPKLHTEYYYNAATTGAPQFVEGVSIVQLGTPVRFAPDVADPPGMTGNSKWQSINYDRGCIVITSLTSSRADEARSNFWFDELGLNPNIQCPVSSTFAPPNTYYTIPQPTDLPAADATPRHVPNFDFPNMEIGVRRTAPYLTPSFLLPEAKYTLVYNINNQVNPNSIHPIEADDTTAIFGADSLAAILARDAYFKVIINGIPANRLHSEDSVEFISSIVSKYYSGQSYTNGFTTDSIMYVHQGAPIQISAFDINIYNSDNSPAVIGSDNSIFIEINKSKPDGLD